MSHQWSGKFYEISVKQAPEPKKTPQKVDDVPKKDITKTPTSEVKETEKLWFDEFDKFYEDNKTRIMMTETFPRNEEAIEKMLQVCVTEDECTQKLCRLLAVGLQHINFSVFRESLLAAAHEAVAICIQESRKIVVVINGDIFRSNTWCTLLVWPVIRSYVIAIVEAGDLTVTNEKKEKLIYVYIDDAIYSGQQFKMALDDTFLFDEEAMKEFSSEKEDRPKYRLIVAAITNKAMQMIARDYPFVIFPWQKILLKTSDELAKSIFNADYDEFTACLETSRQFKISRFEMQSCLTYFDHKIPDDVSVNNVMMAFAPVLITSKGEVYLSSLIRGCNIQDYRKPDQEIDPFNLKMTKQCPRPFYKFIVYRINGKDFSMIRLGLDENQMSEKLTILNLFKKAKRTQTERANRKIMTTMNK